MVNLQRRRLFHASNRAMAFAAPLIGGYLVFHCGLLSQEQPASPIHFSPRPIAFSLDSSETPQRHAPETMAGGVAVLDYDRDGKPDIFFTNGADIDTLKKSSPKYWNRLFHNNGDGTFTRARRGRATRANPPAGISIRGRRQTASKRSGCYRETTSARSSSSALPGTPSPTRRSTAWRSHPW